MPLDFTKLPKSICDGSSIAFNKHLFMLAFKAGEEWSVFAMVPEDTKGLLENLAQAVAAYEQQYDKKIERGNVPIPSLIDLSDKE